MKARRKDECIADMAKMDFDCGIVYRHNEKGFEEFKQQLEEEDYDKIDGEVNEDDFTYYFNMLNYYVKEEGGEKWWD